MAIAYLALGTNIGNKRRNMITAAALLAERVGDVLALSGFYETEPWGFQSDQYIPECSLAAGNRFAAVGITEGNPRDRIGDGTYAEEQRGISRPYYRYRYFAV